MLNTVERLLDCLWIPIWKEIDTRDTIRQQTSADPVI